MVNGKNILKDYKANIPLDLIAKKYKLPVHLIISLLYYYATKGVRK